MKHIVLAAIFISIAGGGAMAQGTGNGPAKDPTENGGNAVVNRGAGSGTGTTDRERGLTTGSPKADPTENGGNTVVNRGAGSGTGTERPAGAAR